MSSIHRSWCRAGTAAALWLLALPMHAADDRDAASTINHAFATELGTGAYDLGGSSIFVLRVTPEWSLRDASHGNPGVRLISRLTAGSVGFRPENTIGGELPRRIDSFSVMPGIELDFRIVNEWVLTPWVRAGASFAAGSNEGWLYAAGMRLSQNPQWRGFDVARHHDLSLLKVDYRSEQASDTFVRVRNAVDLRRHLRPLSSARELVASVYAIVDLVADPPESPVEAGSQSAVQLELGLTFNTDPRFEIGWLRWPRLGFGYRYAGDFSGWRIVVGAPF